MNQFGLAFRMPIEALDTEFGLYWQQLYSRTPVISPRAGLAVPGPTLFVAHISNLIAGVNPATGQPIQPYRGLPASSAQWHPRCQTDALFAITAATTLWAAGRSVPN